MELDLLQVAAVYFEISPNNSLAPSLSSFLKENALSEGFFYCFDSLLSKYVQYSFRTLFSFLSF